MKQWRYALCCLPLLYRPLTDTDIVQPNPIGRWKPEHFERVAYSPEGELLRRDSLGRDSKAFTELLITDKTVTYQFVAPKAPLVQSYRQQADTLFLSLKPDKGVMKLFIKHLDAHHLTLRLTETQTIGPRHYRIEFDTYLVR
jgi:hypothetical protein